MTGSKRFLFSVFSEAGKLNPTLAVAQRLENRGHEVILFCGQGDISAKAAGFGLKARCIAGVGDTAGFVSPIENRSSIFTEKVANPKWAARWLKGVLITPVPAQVTELSAVLDEIKPAAMLTHPMGYASAIAASLAKVPWAGVSTGFMGLIPDTSDSSARATFDLLAGARRELFERYGLTPEFRVSDVISPWLNVTFASEELFPRSVSGNFHSHLVGPSIPIGGRGDDREFPWERLPTDRPIVLVCFGSHLSPKVGTYAALIDSLTADEAFFVIVTRDPADLPAVVPSHVLVTGYVPQLPMLERVAVMVNHGGSNSVMECLSRGKPMLTVPFLYDQHEIAARVVAAGVGAMLDSDGVTADACRAALLPLLDPGGAQRDRAEALKHSLGDGAAITSALLERLSEGVAIPVTQR